MRIYNRWSGNPRGVPEDSKRCVVSVANGGRSMLVHQCSRKRGKGRDGLFCRQHRERDAKGAYLSIPEDT